MTRGKAEQASRYRSIQILLFVFSLIFFFIIAYGYFHLFVTAGYFLATLGAAIMATFAWYLARVIGTSPGGLRRHWVMFIPLMIVSAAGVYNSLMLYLEGNRILTDAIVESQAQFAQLQSTAEEALRQRGATERTNRVRSRAEALYSEILNPANCGQGPEARRLVAELQRELPGFTPLSTSGRACERTAELVEDYRRRIESLLERAEWNEPVLSRAVARSTQSRQALDQLRSTVSSNYAPTLLQRTLSALETQDSIYRDLRYRLGQQVDVRDLREGLHLSEAQSLGNAFKLPALFIERLDEPASYIYLLIALGFDLFMVYLFQLGTTNRTRPAAAGHSLSGAW